MILFLDVVTTAAILYVVACGLLLIFGVLRIINFAHGALMTLGGYAALICGNLGLSPWAAFPLAAVVGGVVGALVERLVTRSLYSRPLDAILATWGLSIVLGQVVTVVFGRGIHFAVPPLAGTIEILGQRYSAYRLSFVASAAVLAALMAAALRTTRLGLETRAVILNEDLAEGLGINSDQVRFITFVFGSALAALAGTLVVPISSIDPNMGIPWLISAFMLALISGHSIRSLMMCCVLLGGAQVLISTFIDPILGGLAIPVVAALTLRLRPKVLAS